MPGLRVRASPGADTLDLSTSVGLIQEIQEHEVQYEYNSAGEFKIIFTLKEHIKQQNSYQMKIPKSTQHLLDSTAKIISSHKKAAQRDTSHKK